MGVPQPSTAIVPQKVLDFGRGWEQSGDMPQISVSPEFFKLHPDQQRHYLRKRVKRMNQVVKAGRKLLKAKRFKTA